MTNNPQVKLELAFLRPVNGRRISRPVQMIELMGYNIAWRGCRLMNDQFLDFKL